MCYIYLYRNDDDENNYSNNNGTVITYRNKLLEIETFAEPLERTYDENDLLTKIYHINPNWKPGDPEDYRYITSYINEGYTGFLPVKLKINPPNFVHQWGIENFNGSITWKSLPIIESGKFKYYYNGGQEGPFALGFIPVKRYNQNTEDYDFIVNIPIEENIATLKITDGVLDSILTMEGGTLNLPSSLPALNQATAFNANGKDYATGVSIDLSELTYYPNMPMPQFNNGNGGNIIEITENNSRSTFEETDGNRKNIEYVTTPENPTPAPLMRSIVVKNSKGKTRDATTSNIVGYIDVNIPPPNISQVIQRNGYYNFNNDWNALVEGTEQNHKLAIQVPAPKSLSKTVEINTIGNNTTTIYLPEDDGERNILPIFSNINGNEQIELITDHIISNYKNEFLYLFDQIDSTYYRNVNESNNYLIVHWKDGPKLISRILIDCIYTRSPYLYHFHVSGSNDNETYNDLYDGEVNTNNIWTTADLALNTQNVSYSYYKIYFYVPYGNAYDNSSRLNNLRFMEAGEFHFFDRFTIINKTTSDLGTPIMKSYNTNNQTVSVSTSNTNIQSNFTGNITVPLESKTFEVTSTGTTTITPSSGYYGIKQLTLTTNIPPTNPTLYTLPTIETNDTYNVPNGYDGFAGPITVSVPSTQINNYSGYTSSNPLVINQSGTGSITIPSGYTGLDTIYYNITVPQWTPIKYKQASYYSSSGTKLRTENLITRYVTSEYLVEGQVFICVNKTTNACFGYKCLSTSMTLTLPDGNWYGYKSSVGSSEAIGNATILTNSGDTIISFQIQSGGSSLNSSSIHSFSIQQYQYDE